MARINPGRSSPRPSRQARSRMFAMRMWWGSVIGSESSPSSASSPEDAASTRSAIASRSASTAARGRREGAQRGEREAGRRPGRVDREVGRGTQAPDAIAVLAPVGEALAPEIGTVLRVGLRVHALASRLALVDPGLQVGRAQLGEGEQEVPEVALRVEDERRHTVQRGLLQQRDAEAGLAAAGHADADGVGGQVLRVVQVGLGRDRRRRRVPAPTEIEGPQLLPGRDLSHRCSPRRAQRRRPSRCPRRPARRVARRSAIVGRVTSPTVNDAETAHDGSSPSAPHASASNDSTSGSPRSERAIS